MFELGNQRNKEKCLELLYDFFRESPYKDGEYYGEKVSLLFDRLTEDKANSLILVYVKDGDPIGIIVGTTTEMLFSTERVATELVWYVKPEYRNGRVGLEMFDKFQYWAKEVVTAKYLVMAHLGNETLSKLYKKRGFEKQEESWCKRIN